MMTSTDIADNWKLHIIVVAKPLLALLVMKTQFPMWLVWFLGVVEGLHIKANSKLHVLDLWALFIWVVVDYLVPGNDLSLALTNQQHPALEKN
jgi:hypothetical protein